MVYLPCSNGGFGCMNFSLGGRFPTASCVHRRVALLSARSSPSRYAESLTRHVVVLANLGGAAPRGSGHLAQAEPRAIP